MSLPGWAIDLLRSPGSGCRLQESGSCLLDPQSNEVARIESGVVRLPTKSLDQSIQFYRKIGGPHFYERSATPFAMSSLDTPIYHDLIDEMLPSDRDGVVVDVGGGDGRMAAHCLGKGFRRIVVIDAVAEALLRFRSRVEQQSPEHLDRLLLIEADARVLPLRSECADAVLAIEALCYLNEDYDAGLAECARCISPVGKILLSDRDYEGGAVLRLLYGGVPGLLELGNSRSLWDGTSTALVRSRCFTEAELLSLCKSVGLAPIRVYGISLLSVLIGYLNGAGSISPGMEQRMSELKSVLLALAREGRVRRCHTIIAQRASKS